jgi:hypothetical protein
MHFEPSYIRDNKKKKTGNTLNSLLKKPKLLDTEGR